MKLFELTEDVVAVAAVQSSQLFAGLEAQTVSTLLEAGQVVVLQADERIVTQGEPSQELYMVISGSVRVERLVDDQIDVVAVLSRPAVFGEIAALTQQSRNATVIAAEESKLVRFPGLTVREVSDRVHRFGRRLAALMAARSSYL